MDVIPYSFTGVTSIPRLPQGAALPGQAQGVFITLASDDYQQFMVNKIIAWFRDRDEVDLVDYGMTDKAQSSYIILEWLESTVDQLFCDILRDEELVDDYTVYTRDLH